MKNPDQLRFGVAIVNDRQMTDLNRKHRGLKHSTDVLSFELNEKGPDGLWVGEVVISRDFAKKQAKKLRHSFEKEVAFLVAHGVMHLLGIHHGGDEYPNSKIKDQKSK